MSGAVTSQAGFVLKNNQTGLFVNMIYMGAAFGVDDPKVHDGVVYEEVHLCVEPFISYKKANFFRKILDRLGHCVSVVDIEGLVVK